MKIALITIHNANNYGAIFQAYATQVVLSKYGDVKIINYENRHVSRSFDLIRFVPSVHGVMGFVKDVLRLFPRYRVISKFERFIYNNLNLTCVYSSSDLKDGKAPVYDVYVSGSDQIWNPICISEKQQIDGNYFLEFAANGMVKLSYASSMGGYKYTEAEASVVKSYLQGFDSISVRELDAKLYLETLLGKPVQHVLDPTLLLDKSEWLHVAGGASNTETTEDYILLYTVPKSPLIREVVDQVSKKLQMKVIAIDQGLTASAKVNKQIRDAGPEEFLRFFAGAKYVITDSFHGVCYSLNFEIPFVAVSSGIHSNRIESLLNLVGLEERLVKNNTQIKRVLSECDYTLAYNKLHKEREKSMKYISKSLS